MYDENNNNQRFTELTGAKGWKYRKKNAYNNKKEDIERRQGVQQSLHKYKCGGDIQLIDY